MMIGNRLSQPVDDLPMIRPVADYLKKLGYEYGGADYHSSLRARRPFYRSVIKNSTWSWPRVTRTPNNGFNSRMLASLAKTICWTCRPKRSSEKEKTYVGLAGSYTDELKLFQTSDAWLTFEMLKNGEFLTRHGATFNPITILSWNSGGLAPVSHAWALNDSSELGGGYLPF